MEWTTPEQAQAEAERKIDALLEVFSDLTSLISQDGDDMTLAEIRVYKNGRFDILIQDPNYQMLCAYFISRTAIRETLVSLIAKIKPIVPSSPSTTADEQQIAPQAEGS